VAQTPWATSRRICHAHQFWLRLLGFRLRSFYGTESVFASRLVSKSCNLEAVGLPYDHACKDVLVQMPVPMLEDDRLVLICPADRMARDHLHV
jgi:hypothetical protein